MANQQETVTTDAAAPEPEAPWPNPLYSWFVVGVLMLAYMNSFIDRQILSLLVEPIRADLGISDTQVSLLAGLAFSIFYTLMGVPLARLADQSNRRNIIIVGIGSWSVMTALCGAAQNFWQLFLARIGVGVGEAALSPAAFSMIADYFPKQRLARAISVYSMGVYFGAGLALMIGGVVIKVVSALPPTVLPVIGEVQPWKMTFFFIGMLGLPVMLLIFLIREPLRRGSAAKQQGSEGSSFAELRQFLRENRSTVTWHFAAYSFIGIAIVNYLTWAPTLFIRTYGWDAPKVGLVYGGLTFVLGTAGVYTGGFVADWLHRRGHPDAILRATLYGGFAALPVAVATPLMPNETLAVLGLALTTFLLAYPQGLPAAALQVIAPNRLRAQMTALYFLVGNLVSLGIGPTLVALVTDYGFGDPQALRYSLAIVCGAAIPLGIVSVWLSLKPYRVSVARANARPD